MIAEGYYRINPGVEFSDIENDVEDLSRYVSVNCAGRCTIPEPFIREQPGGRNDYYVMYLYAGRLSVTLENEEKKEPITLAPGQLLVFPPHKTFGYRNQTSETVRYLWFHITGYGAAGLLSDCLMPLGVPSAVGFPKEAEEKFGNLFRAFLIGDPCRDILTCSCVMDICAMFGRILTKKEENDKQQQTVDPKRIYRSLSFVHRNLSKPISVRELAEMENLGASRYRALFHRVTGLSPIRYITIQRMQRATELLSQTALSISAVAESVGYEDSLYFSRVFRNEFGVSPQAYRIQKHP